MCTCAFVHCKLFYLGVFNEEEIDLAVINTLCKFKWFQNEDCFNFEDIVLSSTEIVRKNKSTYKYVSLRGSRVCDTKFCILNVIDSHKRYSHAYQNKSDIKKTLIA